MVQPRKVNRSDKNKALHRNQVEAASTSSKNKVEINNNKAKIGRDGNKKIHHFPVQNKNKNNNKNKKDDLYYYYNSSAAAEKEQSSTISNNNPNLTKKDRKMIEKIQAKMEYHEIRDEYEEVDKLREQIVSIEENANLKAMKKAEKMAAAAAMA